MPRPVLAADEPQLWVLPDHAPHFLVGYIPSRRAVRELQQSLAEGK